MGNPAFHQFSHHGTLNAVSFRTEMIGRELAMLKARGRDIPTNAFNSRLARGKDDFFYSLEFL
jgi:hypothetical protein